MVCCGNRALLEFFWTHERQEQINEDHHGDPANDHVFHGSDSFEEGDVGAANPEECNDDRDKEHVTHS